MVYVARPLNCVCHDSTLWQESASCVTGAECRGFVNPGFSISGTPATTAQLSVTARPVLVPAWSTSPLRSRAWTVASTPCQ